MWKDDILFRPAYQANSLSPDNDDAALQTVLNI